MFHGQRLPSLIHPNLEHERIVTAHLVIGQQMKRICFQIILDNLSQILKTILHIPACTWIAKCMSHNLTQIMSTHHLMYIVLKTIWLHVQSPWQIRGQFDQYAPKEWQTPRDEFSNLLGWMILDECFRGGGGRRYIKGHIVCGSQHHKGLNIHGTEISIAKSQVRRHRSGTLWHKNMEMKKQKRDKKVFTCPTRS